MERKIVVNIAEEFIEENGVDAIPTDLDKIFADYEIGFYENDKMKDDEAGYILVSDEPLDKFDGHKRVIVVNANHPSSRQRFTAAHELGHFVLHAKLGEIPIFAHRDKVSYTSSDKQDEWDANVFAANLLMPKKFIERTVEDFLKKCQEQEVVAYSYNLLPLIASTYAVSEQAAKIRLKALGYIR